MWTCSVCHTPFSGPSRDRWPRFLPVECDECREQRQERERRERHEEEERQRRECELQQKLAPVERYGRCSHYGPRLEGARFASYGITDQNRAARAVCEQWLRTDARPNLIIIGPVGSGKSHLAACLHNALVGPDFYVPCLWLSAPALLGEIKRGFRDDELRAKVNHSYELAQEAPVLFLDDLGKTHPGRDVSWLENELYGIVDARYRALLPTVITTEWRSDALADRVGVSVVSRLIDDAMVAGIGAPSLAYRRLREVPA